MERRMIRRDKITKFKRDGTGLRTGLGGENMSS